MKLSETKRLEEIADEAFGFPLEVIPRAYIPVNGDCSVLSRETRNRWIERIGRRIAEDALKETLS